LAEWGCLPDPAEGAEMVLLEWAAVVVLPFVLVYWLRKKITELGARNKNGQPYEGWPF
jgi:hypothetical protein